MGTVFDHITKMVLFTKWLIPIGDIRKPLIRHLLQNRKQKWSNMTMICPFLDMCSNKIVIL